MILTPTYHIFEMFKVHMDAILQPVELTSNTYNYEGEEVPQLSVSASKDAAGKLNISICNTDPKNSAQVDCDTGGYAGTQVTGRILTSSSMNAHNTFDQPDQVKPRAFTNVQLYEQGFSADIPPMSVVVLTLE
jgi:alpha-N-arabinofuranosidase